MKRVKVLLSLMVITMSVMVCNPVMAQTRKEKKAAKKAEWEFQQKKKEMERQRILDSITYANPRTKVPYGESTLNVPCYNQSRNDKEFIRALGTGEAGDMGFARRIAIQRAQSNMLDHLYNSVKGIATDYYRSEEHTSELQSQ